MSSKPSAYACMSPYSIPLWTIFTKWPAPAGRRAPAVLGREASRTRARRRCDGLVLAADHEAVADLEAPDPARDAGVDEADPVLGGDRGARAASRGSSSCRRRRSRRPRRAGSRAPERPPRSASPAGIMSQTTRGASSWPTSSSSERRRARRRERAYGGELVAALLQALDHVAAHAAEADHRRASCDAPPI